MPQDVAIINTGVANTASVAAAMDRLGAVPRLTRSARDVERSELLVLPGVGAFSAGMSLLGDYDLITPLRERIEAGTPTLCVCLGMQLLFEASDESPGVAGLGVAPGAITEFPGVVQRPQFGWNIVEVGAVEERGYAYFANSYRATGAPEGWLASWSEHGGPFLAAMRRGCVLACQFHPELSGAWGRALLGAWLQRATLEVPC